MEQLDKFLRDVYSKKNVEFVKEGVASLIGEYKEKIPKPGNDLSEKDVMLITYADQLSGSNGSKISVLNRFLKEQVKGQISSVHLLPFYPYSSDDGFSVIDYYTVDSDAGSWEDVEKISVDYHLMFDAVINHISKDSAWVKGYLNEAHEFEDYFIDGDPKADYSKVTRPRTSPVLHEFISTTGHVRHLWTTFSEDQVDLNYANPQVFLHVLDVLMYYLSKGARMLRLDAIGFMWKEPGTSCIHLHQTHQLIKAMRWVLEQVNPKVILITETNVPHQENISYFGNGHDEAQMVYNFTLPPLLAYSLLSEDSSKLTKWAQRLKLPSDEVCFFNFTASHDGVGLRPVQGILNEQEISILTRSVTANNGFISYRTDEKGNQKPYELNCNYLSLLKGAENDGYGLDRFILSQAVMLCMPGLPAIYFHSLVGSENDQKGVEHTGRYRSINREKLDYEILVSELNDLESQRKQVFDRLNELIDVRNNEPAFHPFGAFSFPDLGAGLFAIKREQTKSNVSVICVFNFRSEEVIVNDFSDGELVYATGQGNLTKIPAFGFCWIRSK